MGIKNSTKGYLAQSVRTNGKLVLLVLLGILVAGIGVSLVGIIPEHRALVSVIISDIPAKVTTLLIPIILILKTKDYAEWILANPNVDVTKKGFINGMYLEGFLASLLGLVALAIIWVVAHFISPEIVDMNEGIGVIGGALGIAWGMIGLVYSLQFTKLGEISEGAILFAIGFFVPFGVVVAIQQIFHALELSLAFIAGVPALVGILVLVVSRPVAVIWQERVDL
ncbi:MAG: hypothetical protein FWB88_05035 [Defluviitaleaceae bacterium]|nr:hypothetical protein [Defluviitaleaceae bacterium]MCL2239200.1 hypothetical protein [Defluviitaleaceae bacterium]MCL2240309.1 hypothetical protein [Defluviitaleaceae bacterium]